MSDKIRSVWWSILRDFLFPIAGLFGLYNLFTGKFTDLAIPIVGGICMALLGLPFWDRDDERRREDHDDDPSDASGIGPGKKRDDDSGFTIRIGLPGKRRR